MSLPIPEQALDAAEKEWYARVSRAQYDPPREHIRALFEVAMPFLLPVQGEVEKPEEVQPSESLETDDSI